MDPKFKLKIIQNDPTVSTGSQRGSENVKKNKKNACRKRSKKRSNWASAMRVANPNLASSKPIRLGAPRLGRAVFKALARIPPGLGKVLPKDGVVLSFPPSSFDSLYQNMTPTSTTNENNLAQVGGGGVPENRQKYKKVKKRKRKKPK